MDRSETNHARYEGNLRILRNEITELQTKLLASQDRVSPLQRKLLTLREIMDAPVE